MVPRVLVGATASALLHRHDRARARSNLGRHRSGRHRWNGWNRSSLDDHCHCRSGSRLSVAQLRAFFPFVASNAATIAHYIEFRSYGVIIDGCCVDRIALAGAVTHGTASIAHIMHHRGR